MSLKATAVYRPRSSAGQFIEARIKPSVRRGVEESCKLIYDRSQQLVPVDTGELKASGQISIHDGDKTVVGYVEYTAEHAPYLEYGTGIVGASSPGAGKGPYSQTWPGMVAQPYLRPAIDESREEIKDIMRDNLVVGMR